MQIDPGTVAATAAPSGLQMISKAIVGGVTEVDEMQIDAGRIVVSPTEPADNTLESSHASASPCIVSEGCSESTANLTNPISVTVSPSTQGPRIVSEGRSTANLPLTRRFHVSNFIILIKLIAELIQF